MPAIVIRTLADVPAGFSLYASCGECGHAVPLDRVDFARRHGREAPLAGLRRRLPCSRCGARKGRLMQVWSAPGGFRAG